MTRHLFLIGFMGSGKTHWGRALAEQLGAPFLDLDTFIEANEGKNISSIFSEIGENGFRVLEREYLRRLAAMPPAVVATGGGTPCFFNNMDWMNAAGTTVYLKVSANVLFERLEKENAHRPLLAGLSGVDLQVFVERLLTERTPFYSMAQVVVELGADEREVLRKLLFLLKSDFDF